MENTEETENERAERGTLRTKDLQAALLSTINAHGKKHPDELPQDIGTDYLCAMLDIAALVIARNSSDPVGDIRFLCERIDKYHRGLANPECRCFEIQCADPLRHFRGCPLRKPLPPDHPEAR